VRPRIKILFEPEDEAEAVARRILSIEGKEFDFLRKDEKGTKLVVSRRTITFRNIAILLRKMKPNTGKGYMKAFPDMVFFIALWVSLDFSRYQRSQGSRTRPVGGHSP
jgi:hypothetical protein